MNNTKVFVLLAGLTALLVAVGQMLGGTVGALAALGLSAAMNLFMYWGSSSMVLRSYGAHVVSEQDAPALHQLVDKLRRQANLPMPLVAIAPHAQANAFATGRNSAHAVVCVTEGLLQLVSDDELEGVIAHEIAHIRNHDMLLQTVAATMAGAIGSLAQMSLLFGGRANDDETHPFATVAMLIVGPIAAMVLQFAISRQREFKADAVGAEISGNPRALAGALAKLEMSARRIPMHISPTAAPLAIVNPLAAFSIQGVTRWFCTHPSTAERISRLQSMAEHDSGSAIPGFSRRPPSARSSGGTLHLR